MNDDLKEYLIHCYLYYKLNSPVISDSEFDRLCKKLLDSGISSELVSEEDLRAGTGYSIKEYPEEVVKAAEELASKPAPVETISDFEAKRFEPFKFTRAPGETHILLALYRDYKHFRMLEKMNEVHAELVVRWEEGVARNEFEKYFSNWNLGPKDFNL